MISVKLVAATKLVGSRVENEFLALASHAALKCYQARSPEMDAQINIKNRLFETGHHTTLEHFNFTFDIEGIAVSDITLGAHLASPFYDSDQRSGRFCGEMFNCPDIDSIRDYLNFFWPKVSGVILERTVGFIKSGISIYQENIETASKIAANLIAQDRPKASDKYIEQNAAKIAQEQLRVFVSTIFPTGFDFTIDHIALVSLYKAAWSPGMACLTQKMADSVLAVYPELDYMFSRRNVNWSPKMFWPESLVRTKPGCRLLEIDHKERVSNQTNEYSLKRGRTVIPESSDMYPVDLLHYLPEFMDNNISGIKSQVEISLACMGQDQRHRTISRGEPFFTGHFYLPPIPDRISGLRAWAKKIMNDWRRISLSSLPSLAAIIAPYGAMMSYAKRASFNALFHEQNKRLCWCAQEEIYHVGRALRQAIVKKYGKNCSLLQALEPYCFRTGKCAEGLRYCGREISVRESGDYFPERKV